MCLHHGIVRILGDPENNYHLLLQFYFELLIRQGEEIRLTLNAPRRVFPEAPWVGALFEDRNMVWYIEVADRNGKECGVLSNGIGKGRCGELPMKMLRARNVSMILRDTPCSDRLVQWGLLRFLQTESNRSQFRRFHIWNVHQNHLRRWFRADFKMIYLTYRPFRYFSRLTSDMTQTIKVDRHIGIYMPHRKTATNKSDCC